MRKAERERVRERKSVCVCVCERERERERETERESFSLNFLGSVVMANSKLLASNIYQPSSSQPTNFYPKLSLLLAKACRVLPLIDIRAGYQ